MHSDHAERLPEPASELAEGGAGEGVTLPPQEALLDDAGTGEDTVDLAPPRHRLPQIALPDNVVLKGAVQKLVEQKSRLDALAADGQLAGLLPPEWQGTACVRSSCPPSSRACCRSCNRRTWRDRARAPAGAPCAGDDSRWGLDDVAEPKSLAWYLASDERATAGSKDVAEAYLVGALGLAWMQEGRSRPGFLRAMGQDSLAARVTMLGYPPANELALYSVTAHGQQQIWCVHGRRRMRPLVAPWLSVPVLTAYGVPAPVAWPSSFPPVEAVAELLATARQGARCRKWTWPRRWRRSPRTPPRKPGNRSACCSSIPGHRVGISSWAPSSACRRCCWWRRRWRCRGRSKQPRLRLPSASPVVPSRRSRCRGSMHGASI
jgi:hypothetical protein